MITRKLVEESGCLQSSRDTRIVVNDRGQKATFVNEDRALFRRLRVDGCLLNHQIAADWIVTKSDVGDIIVELKGSCVDHGIKQVKKTAELWAASGMRTGVLAALIVANQYPRFTTKIQNEKDKFAKNYRGGLHVVNGNRDFKFESVLKLRDPCKR